MLTLIAFIRACFPTLY